MGKKKMDRSKEVGKGRKRKTRCMRNLPFVLRFQKPKPKKRGR